MGKLLLAIACLLLGAWWMSQKDTGSQHKKKWMP